ncbi:MAG: glycosyltransferase family 4 protein [Pyrinomonadaceae bacterium]
MKKRKIMFFSTLAAYPFWEGSEKHWFEFVSDENVRSTVDCHVVIADSEVTRKKGEALRALGVEVTYFSHYVTSIIRRNIHKVGAKFGIYDKEYAYWYRLIERHRPSLVWITTAATEIPGLRFASELCQRLSIPYVIIIQHAPEHYFCQHREQADAFHSVIKNAHKVVFVSKRNLATVEKAVGYKVENAFETLNGVTREFLDRAEVAAEQNPVTSSGRARLLSLARYSLIAKGQHILLEILSCQKWRERDWELSMVGGSGDFLVRRLVDYFGVDKERVNVMGAADDVIPVIVASDLLVMPSLNEGSPFAMVEAMACGRPAVGTPIGGIPELITNGKTGWLAESTEVPHFERALDDAWQGRASWPQAGANARSQIYSRYKPEQISSDLLRAVLND